MLVLTRKHGEKIIIGDNIAITICAIGKDRVKLAFEAPVDVSIHRQEVRDRIESERFGGQLLGVT